MAKKREIRRIRPPLPAYRMPPDRNHFRLEELECCPAARLFPISRS